MKYDKPLKDQPDRKCECPGKVTKARCCWACGTFTKPAKKLT